MKITSNFNSQYIGNYKKTIKTDKTDNKFSDILQKTKTDEPVKSTAQNTVKISVSEEIQTPLARELTEAEIDYLKNKYNIEDMSIQYIENIRGGYKNTEFSMSEEHDNFINELHDMGILSNKDMNLLNGGGFTLRYFGNLYDMDGMNGMDGMWTKATKINEQSLSIHQKFYMRPLDIWTKEIANYYRAEASKDLETEKKWNERLDKTISPELIGKLAPDGWYAELAEVKNRIADIFDQIFKS